MNPIHAVRRFLLRSHPGITAAALALFTAAAAPAQFEYTYGTPNVAELGITVTRMPNGYLLGGSQLTDQLGVLANWNGNQVFGVSLPTLLSGPTLTPNCVQRTASGGVIVSGEITGAGAGLEAYLAYYAPNGTLWPNGCLGQNKVYRYRADATGLRQGTRVVELAGGGFAAIANVDPGGASSGVLFTTSAEGCLSCWTSYSYFGSPVRFHDLCQDTDGTLLIVGSIQDPVTPWRRTLLLRTTCGAAPIWAFAFTSPAWGEDVEQHAITLTDNGGCAVWGHFGPTSSAPGSFLCEFTGAGGVLWHTRFPTIAGSRPTISRAANGDLWMNGRVADDALILKTNANGVALAARTYGAVLPSIDELFQVVATPDGGFVAAGSTQRFDTTANDTWMLKGNANGDISPLCPSTPYATPQTWLAMIHEPKGLQIASDPLMHYVYMGPFANTAPAAEVCSGPLPIVYTGNPMPTTVSLPVVLPNRIPVPGAFDFQCDAAGLRPFGLSLFGLSMALSPFPFDLFLLGGQPGSTLYLDPSTMALFVARNDGAGEATAPLPIPNDPSLTGVQLNWQVFDFDPALPFPLPLGNSQAMSVVIQ